MPDTTTRHQSSRRLLTALLLFACNIVYAHDVAPGFESLFPHHVTLTPTSAGSLTVAATLGGVKGEFLLDTGASMMTVSQSVFKQLRALGAAVKVRRVGARSASGKITALDVYRVDTLTLGTDCELGPVEVAVMRSGGRNLLGLAALRPAAPFAVSTSPPALELARCGGGDTVVTR
jgi:predicted aspartyl protease